MAVAVAAMAGAILAGQGPLAIAALALTGGVLTAIVIARLGAAQGGAHAEKIDDERTPAPRFRELSSSTTDLERALDRELAVAPASEVSVLSIAIDGLGDIERDLGSHVVQAVSTEVVARLRTLIRADDPLFVGDGAITFVMRNRPSHADDVAVARRLITAFTALVPIAAEHVKVSLSIGIADHRSGSGDAGTLLRRAEIARYEAQRLGGECHVTYSEQLDDRLGIRARLAIELGGAIAQGNQLSLVYQPIFGSNGTEIIGAEALLRWNHPVHGRLDTRLLIEVAEAEDLMQTLGQWILDVVITRLSQSSIGWLSVNISRHQLHAAGFVDDLRARLERAGISPHRLQFEISRQAVEDPEIAATLSALRALGIELTFDADFETPEQLLDYDWTALAQSPLDCIKLPALAMGSGEDLTTQARLWGAASQVRTMGLVLAAKNVETPFQHDVFTKFGTARFQGHYYAPPMTALSIDTLLPPSQIAI
ncbi:EAL domain-containing protein [Pelagibacterium sp. 26DY04]|uniref:EAL domain-containing protein n=1 Tax=Pelagibacterium sp. 26DY04 TaxID=2967130 RepID=UPI002814D314|nr:EAL domain-containing protein [Pelagibacterium sp. 26DY04]WMT86762.1 EAL domain-containing protein [Pelagibacterium sp. 26DY04]